MTHPPSPPCSPRARHTPPARPLAAALLLALLLAGCSTPKPAPSGLAELLERPAERALVEGLRAYDDGQYPQAEAALQRALAAGLASGRDRASAHKLLAFIACTSERVAECEAAFRAARAADPAFVLNRSEAGHPLWGPVYRRVLGAP
jgi:Tfp pilus assembly protein PilF